MATGKHATFKSCVMQCALSYLLTILLIEAVPAIAQERRQPQGVQVEGRIFTPGKREFNDDLLKNLRAPAGFTVSVWARDLKNARMIAVGNDGTVYLTQQEQNSVVALKDLNGRADNPRTVASNLEMVHGITIHQNRVYLVSPKKVWVADMKGDGSLGEPRVIIGDLPDGGQHRARTIAVGPKDQMLYITVGSTCNLCEETNKENATMLRATLDGRQRTIYAHGLRHTIGFGWHPQTGEMWGADMGSDWHGDDIPHDELNRITEGGNFGWPFCYDDKQPDKYFHRDPKGTTKEAYCPQTVAPVLTFPAHSSPLGMAFYRGEQFPADYRDDAFIALHGSWNREPASGYKVVRVHFEKGQPVRVEDFLTGFLIENGQAFFGRPAGVAVMRDGSLLVSDDINGVIYRIAHNGSARK